MSTVIEANPVPLAADAEGTIRVGATRVTLESVVAAFNRGAAPEQIVLEYPSLRLADVYASLWYYLENRKQVDGYVARQHRDAEVFRDRAVRDPRGAEMRQALIARAKSAARPA